MHNKWLIAVACCFINILILGTGRLSSLIFVVCLERYGADRGVTSFPFILCYLVRTLAGPLIGYLGAKFGSKSVTIAGCFMAAFGVSACFFAEDILAINLLFGLVFGLGFGAGSSLLAAILSQHFHENLTLANGIAFVGSSIGAAVLPPVTSVLLDTYGVSGTFLVVGAIVLNSIPCAMLLGNPVASTQENLEKEDFSLKINDTTKYELDTPKSSCMSNIAVIDGSTCQQFEPTSKLEGITNKAYETSSEDAFSSNNFGLLRVKRRTSSVLDETPETPVLVSYTTGDSALTAARYDKASRRLSSVFEISMATPIYLQYDRSNCVSALHVGKSILSKPKNPSETEKTGLGSFQIFYDLVFLVICFIQSAFTFCTTVVWTVLIDYVRDKGVTQDREIFFLVFPPIVDMLSRLLMGLVVDLGFMSETNFCSLGFLLLSLTCCMMVWFTSLGLMLFATLTNAFVSGSVMITFPGMIVSFINPKHRTMAMASRFLMFAPMGCAVSPSIDFFRDKLGSYDGFFYLLGFVHGVCFLLTYFIPHLARRRDNKKKLNEKATNEPD